MKIFQKTVLDSVEQENFMVNGVSWFKYKFNTQKLKTGLNFIVVSNI